MFCQKTLQSFSQEIINRWSALSLLPFVTGRATCMRTRPYANGEALQGSHLRKQKPFTNVSEERAAVSLLCLLCMSHGDSGGPAVPWRKDTSSSHYFPCRVMDAQTLPCGIWSKLFGSWQAWDMNADLLASRLLLLLYSSTLCLAVAPCGLSARLQMLPIAQWSISPLISVIFLKETSCLVCMVPNSP